MLAVMSSSNWTQTLSLSALQNLPPASSVTFLDPEKRLTRGSGLPPSATHWILALPRLAVTLLSLSSSLI